MYRLVLLKSIKSINPYMYCCGLQTLVFLLIRRHIFTGLPPVACLGSGLLPQTAARLSRRPTQHELSRCATPPLLAPPDHLVPGPLARSLRLPFPHLLWHLRGAPLVRHGLLGGSWRHRLLHVQVGGGSLQHGGWHRLHLLLVQCEGGSDALQDGSVLHHSVGREHHSHRVMVSSCGKCFV